jgi:hypothetical protein
MQHKSGVDLYLRLLQRVLTNTVFKKEPDFQEEREHRFIRKFVEHYIEGAALSMLPVARLDHLRACIEDVLAHEVPGDVIEAGVWRGGAAIFMRAVLRAHGAADRNVWVADSFQGLPAPDPIRFPTEARVHNGPLMLKTYNHFAVDFDEVRRNFEAFDLLDDRVKFLRGWFKDTLPTAPIEALAVLRLDGDYYESTMDALTSLYHKLSPGGYVIIDDYGEDTWTYCRQAVDAFRRERGITEPMIGLDSKCYYWQLKV